MGRLSDLCNGHWRLMVKTRELFVETGVWGRQIERPIVVVARANCHWTGMPGREQFFRDQSSRGGKEVGPKLLMSYRLRKITGALEWSVRAVLLPAGEPDQEDRALPEKGPSRREL